MKTFKRKVWELDQLRRWYILSIGYFHDEYVSKWFRRTFMIPRLSFRLEYDIDYGMNKRSGWTVKYNGVVLAQLEKFLLVALAKSWYSLQKWELDCV